LRLADPERGQQRLSHRRLEYQLRVSQDSDEGYDKTNIHGLEHGPERHRAQQDRAFDLSRGLKIYQSSLISFTSHHPL
jgi:hypothetical protein